METSARRNTAGRVARWSSLAAGLVLCAAPAFAEGGHEAHGLSPSALDIARPFGIPITNSMIVTWAAALALILFARLATRDMKQVPTGAQNVFEWMVASLYELLEGILGSHLVKRTFWFFATIFIF